MPGEGSGGEEAVGTVVRRIQVMAGAAYVVFAIPLFFSSGLHALVGLTCSAAVTMIAFLWLEEIATLLLQPAAHLHARRLMLRTLARFALLGVSLMGLLFVARFNALSVLLGFSIVVVGIMGEAVYELYRATR